MRGGLGAVKNDDGTVGMGSPDKGLGVEINAQYIGYFRKGEEFHPGVIDFLQFFFREMACFLIHINVVQYGAGLLCHSLPGDQVGMVFRNGDKDVVSLVKMGFAVGAGHQVQGFGGISGIDDFTGAFCIDEFPYHFLRRVVGFGCGNGKDVGSSMGVAVIMGHVVHDCIHHRERSLGGGGVIEINNPVTVDFGLQNREIFSD